jgi:hypothetical protein
MESPTHYELLCVRPEATASEIRAAYRRLMRVYHPDVASSAGAAMAQRLNEAERVLLDARTREVYDRIIGARAAYGAGPRASAPFAARTSGTAQSRPGAWAPPKASERVPSEPWSLARLIAWLAWGAVVFACAALVFVSTVMVFIACYSGGSFTVVTIAALPPALIAVTWLVIGLKRLSRVLLVVMLAGAALWPLTAFGVEPFATYLGDLPSTVLPLVTIAAAAAIVLRIASPHFSDLLRDRRVPRSAHA